MEYGGLFGDSDFYKKRLELLADIPFQFVIGELASINFQLKLPEQVRNHTNFEHQVALARVLVRRDSDRSLINQKVIEMERKFLHPNDAVIFFTRASCLYAINELIPLVKDEDANKFIPTEDDWFNIFKYILCINEEIESDIDYDLMKKADPFEPLYAGMLFGNELALSEISLMKFDRFLDLIEFLESNTILKPHLDSYLKSMNVTVKEYVQFLGGLHYKKDERGDHLRCHHRIDPKETKYYAFVQLLSRRSIAVRSPYDLIDIRKSPLLQYDEENFIVLDLQFLLDRLYTVFINELFFEHAKPNGLNREGFMGEIGLFFEDYCNEKLATTFNEPFVVFKPGEELLHSQSKEELADFYLRKNSKVSIGQIKVTPLLPSQFQGSLDNLFKDGKDEFYKRFGLNQLVGSLQAFFSEPNEYDSKLKANKKCNIYPVLILNELAVQFHLAPLVFQKAFDERMKDVDCGKHYIGPLCVLHVSDVELIHNQITSDRFIELLKKTKKRKLVPVPFNQVIENRDCDFKREYKVLQLLQSEIN